LCYAIGVENGSQKATAIVAAFNERPRISAVLSALSQAKYISEVIVVDDGSSDGTADLVKEKFPEVHLLTNDQNRGKAFSMNRGVTEAKNDVIFFCDADLDGLTSESVDDLILPVISDQYDMFIGIRNNVMQKSVLPFALNSGERAMRKSVWEKLPAFYKHRFRIEAGLNCMVYFTGAKGMGHKVMPYRQTLKETKWGFLKGQRQRLGMNIDVLVGWLRAIGEFYFWRRVLSRLFVTKKAV
jgi:glycosyltransferase involved in cell wall biosynthesis